MTAYFYFFRFVDQSRPTGWVGFACGPTQEEIIWQIDQHGDPYAVEIKTAKSFSACWFEENTPAGDLTFTQHEVSEQAPFSDSDGWRKPSWTKEPA